MPWLNTVATAFTMSAFRPRVRLVDPWKNPRWVIAFVSILIMQGAVVFGLVRIAHVKLPVSCACVIILSDIGILVWFRRSVFWRTKAIRDVIIVLMGTGIVLAGCSVLYEKSESGAAALLILGVVLVRMVWRKPLLKRLRAENEKQKSV
jgi:hypothetical protein